LVVAEEVKKEDNNIDKEETQLVVKEEEIDVDHIKEMIE
jgi:hypothetical protein